MKYARLFLIAIIIWLFITYLSTEVFSATYTIGSDPGDDYASYAAYKAGEAAASAGDIISFRKGDTFRETIDVEASGTSGNVITYTSHGTGADPIISGADLFATWETATNEVITDGTFAAWDDDRELTNWTNTAYSEGVVQIENVGSGEGHGGAGSGACNLYSAAGTAVLIRQFGILTAGTAYIAVVDVSYDGAGSLTATFGSVSVVFDGVGTHYLYAVSDNVDFTIKRTAGATDITVDSVSVYEAPTNSYYAAAATEPMGLWVNGTHYTRSRWPNTGWANIDSTTSTTVLQSDVLTQEDDYWIGGYVILRDSDWRISMRKITDSDYDATTITYAATSGTATLDYKYYLEGRATDLNANGEWCWNDDVNRLYLYDSTADPDTYNAPGVEGAVRDYCVDTGGYNYITITGLDLRHSVQAAINVGSSTNVTISSNTIQEHVDDGIVVTTGTDIDIDSNTFTNMYCRNTSDGMVVSLSGSDTITITDNTISGIGVNSTSHVAGRGLSLKADNVTVSGNVISNAGGAGIVRQDDYDNVVITGNTIYNVCQYVSDYGAIYGFEGSSSGTGNVIEKNIIYNVQGSDDSTPDASYVYGIYYDSYCDDSRTSYNLIYDIGTAGDVDAGIFISKGTGHRVYNNTVYNCPYGLLLGEGTVENSLSGNVIKNNIFWCSDDAANYPVRISRNASSVTLFGTMNNNCFYSSNGESVFYGTTGSETEYTLTEWQTSGNDDVSINIDPKLADVAGDDYRITNSSLCIDAGVNVGLSSGFGSNAIVNEPDIGYWEVSYRVEQLGKGIFGEIVNTNSIYK